MRMVDGFRHQSRACAELGSPMYAALIDRIAGDVEHGGVSADVLTGHEADRGPSALALRLVGSLHRMVLAGAAPELSTFYPSAGGVWDAGPGWAAVESVLRDKPDRVREWLDQSPQTNEIGRATGLMGGLLRIGERYRFPVRLFEIGSSGGLNLRADHFCYVDDWGMGYGRADSPVQLVPAWRGYRLKPWEDMVFVERLGSDISPVDVSSEAGRLTLMSYVWPDQTERFDRLRAAFEVAAEVPAEVRGQDAVSFVSEITLAAGALTVLWHSVMWQYLSRVDQTAVSGAIEALSAQATESAPFAHLCLEPTRRTPGSEHEFLVVLRLSPTGQRRILGEAAPHGVPTTWEGGRASQGQDPAGELLSWDAP